MPIIPATRRLRQVDHHELEVSLDNIERPCLQHITHKKGKKMLRNDVFSVVPSHFL